MLFRSVLDFRPRAISSIAYEVSGAQTLASNEDLRTTFTYYLSRIDKITIDRTGAFQVVSGVPSITPTAPKDIDAAITLYELNIPAYTFQASDVRANKYDLKRYTMKDIAKLENRIETLEYTSSLSLLEADANQKELVDKFKSGFIVDNFRSQNVGDFEDASHQVAIDAEVGELRPVALAKSVDMYVAPSLSSGYRVTGDAITLPYTEVAEIDQTLASSIERLQPYTLFNFTGSAALTPSSDVWVSTVVKPDIVINNPNIGSLAF